MKKTNETLPLHPASLTAPGKRIPALLTALHGLAAFLFSGLIPPAGTEEILNLSYRAR